MAASIQMVSEGTDRWQFPRRFHIFRFVVASMIVPQNMNSALGE
jgi:hypothetical protein